MTQKQKIVGLIPARGGSKELTNKNIRLLNGKPLIAYTVEAARESGLFDQIVVSSDSEAILAHARDLYIEADLRDATLAQDATPMDPVIADFIQQRQLSPNTIIILLQPTSPLRKAGHIQEAYQWYRENNCDCLVSVKTLDSKVLKASVQEGNFLAPIYKPGTEYTRRQDLPVVFLPNGAIYIFSVEKFLVEQKIPRGRSVPFVMTREESFDIDTEADLRQCSRLLLGMPERRSYD